ncbi:MAG: nucleotidyltransferase domain-containing protein [Bacteriovoracaceae bacterium]|nr:nucleotidyltransferase domain-containing protein [Bacteriovoracaceae bacterium]
MKDKSTLYSDILKQAESLAKEFSYCIHSVYLIGSAVNHPDSAHDLDIVVFYEGEDQLGQLLWRNFLSLDSKIDCTCVNVSQNLSHLHIEHPFLRLYMSLSEHGKLLYGKKMNFPKLSLERVWAFRWWCLFLDVLNPEVKTESATLQSHARVASGEISAEWAYSKHSVLKAYSQMASPPLLSRREIYRILSSGLERFKAQQTNDVEISSVISVSWASGLERCLKWLYSSQGDHLKSHTIRELLMNFDILGLYIEKLPANL